MPVVSSFATRRCHVGSSGQARTTTCSPPAKRSVWLVSEASLRASTTAYQPLAEAVVAVRMWDPSAAVAASSTAPVASTEKAAGTCIRTDPRSPKAQAMNVAKAGSTRTSLAERGAPAGSTNERPMCAACPAYSRERNTTVTRR